MQRLEITYLKKADMGIGTVILMKVFLTLNLNWFSDFHRHVRFSRNASEMIEFSYRCFDYFKGISQELDVLVKIGKLIRIQCRKYFARITYSKPRLFLSAL